MSVTTVRLKPEIEKDLEILARDSQRTKSWLINQALKEFIQHRKQEQVRWQETLEALDSVTHGKVVSGEAVHTWLRSWGTPDELPSPEVEK
jgi:predicted transcriptional regulator